MTDSNPGYIVVEGPIGVGKTSLARRLAESFGSELLLEGAAENPFLERFYRNPRQGALSTQLFFLLQRARQIQELRQHDMFRPVRVADAQPGLAAGVGDLHLAWPPASERHCHPS